jgi:hypothetical protein
MNRPGSLMDCAPVRRAGPLAFGRDPKFRSSGSAFRKASEKTFKKIVLTTV